jgi:hypothetical protein
MSDSLLKFYDKGKERKGLLATSKVDSWLVV